MVNSRPLCVSGKERTKGIMTRYFLQDTPLASYERMMMQIPSLGNTDRKSNLDVSRCQQQKNPNQAQAEFAQFVRMRGKS